MEQLLNQLFNCTKDIVVFVIDKNYNYLFFNDLHKKVMHSIWGVEIQLGHPMLSYISDEADKTKAKINFDRCLKGEGFTLYEEYGISTLNRLYYEDTYQPLINDIGETYACAVWVRDITERRVEDAKIRLEQQMLESINTNIQEGIYRSTPEKGVLYVNNALLKMFGYGSMEEFKSVSADSLYKDPSQRNELTQKILSEGGFSNIEIEFLRKDKASFWGLMSGLKVKGSDGEVYFDGAIRDITAQKNSEHELRESKILIESISENVNEAIYRASESGLTYVNKAFLRMFGFEANTPLNTITSTRLYRNPNERKRLISLLQKYGSFENEEIEFVRTDGQIFIGLISSTSFKDKNGVLFWDGAIRDVTEEREEAKRNRENEALLASINKNINEAIYRSSTTRGLIYVNDAFVQMFGYDSAAELLNKQAPNLYRNPADREALGEELIQLGFCYNREVEFKRKDGTTFWGTMSTTAIDGETEDETIFDGAIRDINNEKLATLALSKQYAMTELLMNISSKYINFPLEEVDRIINISLEEIGRFAKVDRAYVFEVDQDGQHFSNTHEWCNDGIEKAIQQNQMLDVELIKEQVALNFKGSPFIVNDLNQIQSPAFKALIEAQGIKSFVTYPMLNAGEFIGFVGFDCVQSPTAFNDNTLALLDIFSNLLVNIKTRTEKQKELNILLQKSDSQNQRLRDFSFMTSHNIRASVANILGLVQIIETESNKAEYLKLLSKSAEKLDNTIKSISELLNFENEFHLGTKSSCDLKEVVDYVILQNQAIIEYKNAKIEVQVEAPFTVNTKKQYLQSVMYNLLSNALKYGITTQSKSILIKAYHTENQQIIEVIDHGLGIDLEKYGDKLLKIGSRFHITHSDGEGLGLFMTNHQVLAMGGRLEIESKPNDGSTFRIVLEVGSG